MRSRLAESWLQALGHKEPDRYAQCEACDGCVNLPELPTKCTRCVESASAGRARDHDEANQGHDDSRSS